MVLFPPHRYATVDNGIFRGGYPTTRNEAFLKQLELKTIVSLTPKPITSFELNNDVNFMHIKIDKPKESIPLNYTLVNRILLLLEDAMPLYLHCLEGTITNVVLMCYRKAQGWDLKSIVAEAERFQDVGAEEMAFVEKYNFIPEKKDSITEKPKEIVEDGLSRTIMALDLEMP
jgi:tyrosine-protein phosphatase OCA6